MHASGITVNDALTNEFIRCCDDPEVAFFRVEIENDTFKFMADSKLSPSTENYQKKLFAEVKAACEASAKQPAYFFLRPKAGQADSKWLMIMYCPDDSKVRLRMVYAASSQSLRSGLGGAKFMADYNITEAKECTLEQWKEQAREVDREDVMTYEEKVAEEAHMDSQKSLGGSMVAAVVGVAVPISDDAQAAIAEVMGEGGANTCRLVIDPKSEVIGLDGAATTTDTDSLSSGLPEDQPRFIIHQFAHEHDGGNEVQNMLVYFCPGKAKPKLKMFYSTAKANLLGALGKHSTVKNIECSEASEINAETLYTECHPQSQVKETFKKVNTAQKKGARKFRGAAFSADK